MTSKTILKEMFKTLYFMIETFIVVFSLIFLFFIGTGLSTTLYSPGMSPFVTGLICLSAGAYTLFLLGLFNLYIISLDKRSVGKKCK